MLQILFLLHFIISLISFSIVSVGDKCCCCRRRCCHHWSHAELSVTSLSSTPLQGSSACSRQGNRRARCCVAVVEVTGYVTVLCSGSLDYLSNFPSLLSTPSHGSSLPRFRPVFHRALCYVAEASWAVYYYIIVESLAEVSGTCAFLSSMLSGRFASLLLSNPSQSSTLPRCYKSYHQDLRNCKAVVVHKFTVHAVH